MIPLSVEHDLVGCRSPLMMLIHVPDWKPFEIFFIAGIEPENRSWGCLEKLREIG